MYYFFDINEAERVFNMKPLKNFDEYHEYVEGLLIAYCVGTKRSLKNFTHNVNYSKAEATNKLVNLAQNNIRIPTSWKEKDIGALSMLLEDINYHAASSRLYKY